MKNRFATCEMRIEKVSAHGVRSDVGLPRRRKVEKSGGSRFMINLWSKLKPKT